MQRIGFQRIGAGIFAKLQYWLPHHLLSRCLGWLANCQIKWIKTPWIRWWIRHYRVAMDEAVSSDVRVYRCFNDFFTRALRPGVRVFPKNTACIVSPADGTVSQFGAIVSGRMIQAKGFDFSVEALVGDDSALAAKFVHGHFITVYLSPRDYHRVHMPYGGFLRKMIYIPGRLFSVNHATCAHVPRLFARNERVVCAFDTALGPMIVVLVGAMLVASVETVWTHCVMPTACRTLRSYHYPDRDHAEHVALNCGDEMGRFKLGSTVIVLFNAETKLRWYNDLVVDHSIKLWQPLAIPI